ISAGGRSSPPATTRRWSTGWSGWSTSPSTSDVSPPPGRRSRSSRSAGTAACRSRTGSGGSRQRTTRPRRLGWWRSCRMAVMVDDPYLWLEDITGERALAWVTEQNARTLAELATGPRFEQMREQIREVLDSPDKLPELIFRGDHLYNLWKDETH